MKNCSGRIVLHWPYCTLVGLNSFDLFKCKLEHVSKLNKTSLKLIQLLFSAWVRLENKLHNDIIVIIFAS